MTSALADLSAQGVSIWLDDISRERLSTGNLQALVDTKHVVGVTSNPTIFQKAMEKGTAYDEQILDGRVSIEVDPRIANDTDKTIAEAKALWWLVDRPNAFVKIPATEAGLPAIAAATEAGICVNVTLIFSLDRYDKVMDAYLTGLEAAQAKGVDLSTIRSVASFFVSRVDTEVDKRLDKIGTDAAQGLRGKAGIANARLAYERYEKVFGSDRWKALESAGANSQRPLWASTGVKDPAYDDTMYVVELVAPNTVNTMPEATLDAVADHGVIAGSASSTTTSSNCSRSRACRSSTIRGPSCARACRAS